MCRMNFLWLMYSVSVFNYAFSLLLDNTESIYVSKSEFNALKSEVSALRADMTKEKTIIAFVAELTNSIVNPGNNVHIVFDHPILNLGNNYNSRHGIFLAPLPGVYHFAVEITAPPQSTGHSLHVRIMKKKEAVAITFVDSNTHQYLRRTASVVLQLSTGDDVWCQTEDVTGSNTIVGGNTYSMFSGFLIHSV